MKRAKAILGSFDRSDFLIGVGLLLVAVGLWSIYPPAAPIAVGAVLLGFGIKAVS